LPNAASASVDAALTPERRAASLWTTRMPRPPPPAAALTMTGYPILSASLTASSMSSIALSEPGKIGTLASFAVARQETLSPSFAIASGEGPMNSILQSRHTDAKCAFSERKP
jgi:hypothetical protein